MQEQTDTLADRLYEELYYGCHHSEAFQIAKTREITDWLRVQKLNGSETVYGLASRWFWDPTLQDLCIPSDLA